MRNYLTTAFLALALSTGVVAIAQEDHHDQAQTQRYYDSEYKQYHEWNANEDQAYHKYVEEHHQHYREFSKLNARQQREYWKWRHDHPDEQVNR